jgi:lipase
VSHQPKLHHIRVGGLSLAAFEWRAALRGSAPTLWLVHATGFHGRVWDQVIHQLPGHHVIAIEQRGHGRSEGTGFDSWADFGRDQAAMAAALDLQGAVGVGHSMGAHALVQAAAYEPARFRQLVLIDPVIRAPAEYHQPLPPPDTLHPSAQRKNRFASAQEMFERFADRPPYSVFDTQALHDYCQHGLKPAADGQGFELACAPAFEGRIYPMALANAGIYASIRALQVPVLVPERQTLGRAGHTHLAATGAGIPLRPRPAADGQDAHDADGRPGLGGAADRRCNGRRWCLNRPYTSRV